VGGSGGAAGPMSRPAGRGPPGGGRRSRSAAGTGRTRHSGEAARTCNVEAPGGDPALGGTRLFRFRSPD
jgi:hypothetical protein